VLACFVKSLGMLMNQTSRYIYEYS